MNSQASACGPELQQQQLNVLLISNYKPKLLSCWQQLGIMKLRTLLKLTGISYLAFSIFVLVTVLTDHKKPLKEEGTALEYDTPQLDVDFKKGAVIEPTLSIHRKAELHHVELWGKAAVGLYLWQHIFEGSLESIHGDFLKYGEMKIGNFVFHFRTGPMLTTQTLSSDTAHAVLFINGREPGKVKFAMTWLDSVQGMEKLRNFAVVLLGDEQCNNKWLMPYMKINGGFINFAFIIYDVPYIDDKNFHPWPLGVATYRKFPVVHASHISLWDKRKYVCNFLGTLYENSSRSQLMKIMTLHGLIKGPCFVHTRESWLPSETKDSSELYQNAMRDSDITLCPVGKNTECYRIYEAMSYGSVPVIEDVITPGNCGPIGPNELSTVPLRMLKRMNAPVIYIKSWKELPELIENERKLPFDYVVKRRTQLVHWYDKFKFNLRDYFIKQLSTGFSFP